MFRMMKESPWVKMTKEQAEREKRLGQWLGLMIFPGIAIWIAVFMLGVAPPFDRLYLLAGGCLLVPGSAAFIFCTIPWLAGLAWKAYRRRRDFPRARINER